MTPQQRIKLCIFGQLLLLISVIIPTILLANNDSKYYRFGPQDDLIVISEGDPLFYGSFVHLYEKLKEDIVIVFVPGITAMSGSWTNARIPIAMGDASLSIIMGIQNEKEILRILRFSDSAVIMKIGNHLEKVKNALKKAGSFSRAMIVEKATMSEETIMPLETYKKNKAPYFSIILVPYEVSK